MPSSAAQLATMQSAALDPSANSPSRYVLGDELFKSVLIRERKRADRNDQPLVLMLLTCLDPGLCDQAVWNAVLDGLAAATRASDVVGWIQPSAVVGIVLTESDVIEGRLREDMEARVRRQVSQRLHPDICAKLVLQFQLYAGLRTKEASADPAVMPLLITERDAGLRDSGKRGLDMLGSAALLILLAPAFLLIAALIKLKSPGPVFFRQLRVGEGGRPFTMLKFRTMHVNNDSAIHQAYVSQFIQSAVQQSGSASALFKMANDPRVTRIGRFLRKTSLDELPQLINVLRGEMSLVGPRPPIQYEVDRYKRWHTRRVLDVKPGVTGLWQVTGRSRTTFDEMVRLDLRYARTRSLWTDIKILLATPRAVIAGKGAC